MTSSETAFFTGKPEALSLYEVFRTRLLEICPQAEIRVGRTQIGFYNPRFFSAVSFLPARKAKDRPREFITVTFGLAYRNDSPRIDVATEPYPDRWTHHILIASADQIDDELMSWVAEAADFSEAKR